MIALLYTSLVPRPFPFLRALVFRLVHTKHKCEDKFEKRIFPRARVSRVPSAHKKGKGLGTRLKFTLQCSLLSSWNACCMYYHFSKRTSYDTPTHV